MPKVKKYTLSQFKNVLSVIDYYATYNDVPKNEIFSKALIKKATMYNRIKHPEKFTLEELSRIARVIGITIPKLITGEIKEKEQEETKDVSIL